jgi:hypothetical protein
MTPDLRHKLIVGTLSAIIFVIILVSAVTTNRKRKKMTALLAEKLGISLMGGDSTYPKNALWKWIKRPYTAEGPVDRHHVVFQHTHVGKSVYHGFAMRVRTHPNERTYIEGNTLLKKLSISPGMKLVTTGDARFDSQIRIRSNNAPLAAVVFSTPAIKEVLLETWKNEKPSARFEIEKSAIQYKIGGGMGNPKKVAHMAALIRTAAVLADALEAAADVTRAGR